MSNQEGLVRYKGSDRLNHWLIAILFVLLLLFKDTQAFDTKVFAATIVSCTVVWLVAETWAFATAKVLYVEPGSGPDVRPVDTFDPKDL